jgi:hypothetical protein
MRAGDPSVIGKRVPLWHFLEQFYAYSARLLLFALIQTELVAPS